MTRILIVDDKEENIAYLQALLTSPDCAVESAQHGAEALLKARQSPPDVIISDLLMPVMDGYTLLRHWKADARLQGIPFIVYTATYIDPDDERLALNLGADAFILKPTDPEHLVARLHEVRTNAASATPAPPRTVAEDESTQLKLYNDRLIRKLEEKTMQLETANRTLQRDISDREIAEQLQRQMAETQAAILNALPAHIALVDSQGVIISVNEAWRRYATVNVLERSDFCVGQNYLNVCDQAVGDCSEMAKQAAAGIRQVLQNEKREFSLEYPCHSPTEQHWYRLMVTPLDEEHRTGAVVMHVNVTERKLFEEALRASEREFRDLAEAMPQIVWITRPDGWNTFFNRQWMDYTGLTLEESLGHGWNKPFHPDDQKRAWDAWQNATATLGEYSLESRLLGADGTYRWWLVRGVPMQDEAGNILKWFGTCTDIHDLKRAELAAFRANRALKMLSTCNEAMIRAESESELLESICRIAVDTGGYRMAWVGYARNDEARSIHPMAHAGLDDGYLAEIKITWNEHDPLGQGPAGRVIRTGEAVVCADLKRDRAFKFWRGPAERRGYRSVLALPLRDRQHTFGLLGLYSAEVNKPEADELKLLQDLADDLAFGILHLRARLVQQRLQTAVLKVAAAVSATTGAAFYEQLARNMAEALGAQAGFVSQMLPGEQPPSASTLAAVVDGAVIENFKYVIEGTPCENLADSDACVIARGVTGQFPQAERLGAMGAQAYAGRRLDSSTGQPLGYLFVVFREPLDDTDFVMSTLRIFAARAASELERAQTDAQVREQAALIDESHDAIVVSDLEHRITFWSQGAERLYGWPADEARGRIFQELLAADPATFAQANRSVRENGNWSGEIQKETRKGAVLTLNGRWTLLRDADGQPSSILSIDTDITEQKKTEAQFLRGQRMESIGTLAGGIAHDLNNVLAPIMMSLDLLNLKFPDAASRELIGIVASSARRGADMVRQVLSFSRGVEGRRMEVRIDQLIMEIEKIANDTFLKQVEVWTVFPKDLWNVTGDPTQIHQVLLNLCVNARDAMPEGGTLKISAENQVVDMHDSAWIPGARPGPYVVLQVEDTGTGMPPDVVAQIFDPFFTTKELGKGTGLGLSTSLAIVKSHGGFIDVNSRPGKGTTFKLYLPAQTEPSAERIAEAAAEMPCGNGELILVVDDEFSVRQITRQTLEAFGYQVALATDGADALATFATQGAQIAAVVTDLMMPGIDGVAVIRALRHLNPELPIIAVTGLPGGASTAEATSLGVRHFLAKPYTVGTLLQILRKVLGG